MRYAIVQGTTVVNVVVASPDYAAKNGWIYTESAGPGWLYDPETGTFSAPEVDDEQA